MGRKIGQEVTKIRAPNKVIKHYAQSELGERDYLLLLNLYFSKLPAEVLNDGAHLFYLSPKDQIPCKSELPWFKKMPAGRNYPGSLVKDVCKEAGIEGDKTNHSLRATGTTKMWTGHRSLGLGVTNHWTTDHWNRKICFYALRYAVTETLFPGVFL